MSSRIDFTDRSIIQVYQDLAESNVHALEQFLDQMEAIARTHSYAPMVAFTNSIIDFYEGEFRDHVRSSFQQWEGSDYSLDRLALKCGAGRDAAQTGRRYMDELRTGLDGMFRRSFPRIQADTEAPVLDDKDILKINNEIQVLLRSAESIRDQAVSVCNSRSDQNMVYTLILPMINNTGESFCESFRSLESRVEEGSELYRLGVQFTVDSIRTGTILGAASVKWPAYDSFI